MLINVENSPFSVFINGGLSNEKFFRGSEDSSCIHCFSFTCRVFPQKITRAFQYEKENGPWQIHLEEEPSRRSLEDFLAHGGDGVLVSSNYHYSSLVKTDVPVVYLDSHKNSCLARRHSVVECDNQAIAEMAFECLHERGFCHFAFVDDVFHQSWSGERKIFLKNRLRLWQVGISIVTKAG